MSDGYVRRWEGCWATLACPAVLVAFVMWSPAGVAVTLVLAVLFAGVIQVRLPRRPGGPVARDGRIRVRQLAVPSACWGAIAIAVAVLASVSPWLVLLMVSALVGTSPWALQRLARRRRSRRAARRGHERFEDLTPEQIHSLVERLDLAGLCGAWRSSHALLWQVQDAQTRSKVVLLRQEYLDEMERRDGRGFQRWLESDAQAATGDPEAFLRETPGGGDAAAA